MLERITEVETLFDLRLDRRRGISDHFHEPSLRADRNAEEYGWVMMRSRQGGAVRFAGGDAYSGINYHSFHAEFGAAPLGDPTGASQAVLAPGQSCRVRGHRRSGKDASPLPFVMVDDSWAVRMAVGEDADEVMELLHEVRPTNEEQNEHGRQRHDGDQR